MERAISPVRNFAIVKAPACIFTIDVEDWFHILDVPGTPTFEAWDSMPSRVDRNFRAMLQVLAESNVKITLFVLGWVAEKFPELIKEAHAAGHEIASHGFKHELVYSIDRERFSEDIKRSKNVLEDLVGERVHGYRAPGFSVTKETPWFFEELAKAGFTYDSSIFPGSRGHGGLDGAPNEPYEVDTASGKIMEFPISLSRLFGKEMYFFGGGYMRFFPYPLINKKIKDVLAEERPVIFYLHPREIDPEQPRLEMSAKRKFMTYYNISSVKGKMRKIFRDHQITTFRDHIQKYGSVGQPA